MARTQVPVSTITKVGGTAAAGTAADPTNGHYVDLGGYPLEEFRFEFRNTNGTNRVATIKAGGNPPAASAGLGDLAITVPATTGDMTVAGLESAQFIQTNGQVYIDLGASFAGVVIAERVPR